MSARVDVVVRDKPERTADGSFSLFNSSAFEDGADIVSRSTLPA